MTIKQRTFTVDGEKITIKSRTISWCNNFQGWNVKINGKQFKCFGELERAKAEDWAFAKWMKASNPYTSA